MAMSNFVVSGGGVVNVAVNRSSDALKELKGLVENHRYNLGELVLTDKGKLKVINNHKTSFFSNDTKTTADDNKLVRNAVKELITTIYAKDGNKPLYYDAICKRLNDEEYSGQPLTRREVCGYLKLLSKMKLDENESKTIAGLQADMGRSKKVLEYIKSGAAVDVGNDSSLGYEINYARGIKDKIRDLSGKITASTVESNSHPKNDSEGLHEIETQLMDLREELANAQKELEDLVATHADNIAYCERTIKDYSEKPVDDLFRNEHGIGVRGGRTQMDLSREDISGIARSDNVILARVRAGIVSTFKKGFEAAQKVKESLSQPLKDKVAAIRNGLDDKIKACKNRSDALKGDLDKVTKELERWNNTEERLKNAKGNDDLIKEIGDEFKDKSSAKKAFNAAAKKVENAETVLRNSKDIQTALKYLSKEVKGRGCKPILWSGVQGSQKKCYVKVEESIYRVVPSWQREKKEGSGYVDLEEGELALEGFDKGEQPFVTVEGKKVNVMFVGEGMDDELFSFETVKNLLAQDDKERSDDAYREIYETAKSKLNFQNSGGDETFGALLADIENDIKVQEEELKRLKQDKQEKEAAAKEEAPQEEPVKGSPEADKKESTFHHEWLQKNMLEVIERQIAILEGENGEIALLKRGKADVVALKTAFESKMGPVTKTAVDDLLDAYDKEIEREENGYLVSLTKWKEDLMAMKDGEKFEDLSKIANDLKESIGRRIVGRAGGRGKGQKVPQTGLQDQLEAFSKAIESDAERMEVQSFGSDDEMPEPAMDALLDRVVGGLIDREQELGKRDDVVRVGIFTREEAKTYSKSFRNFENYVMDETLRNQSCRRTFDAQIATIASQTKQNSDQVSTAVLKRLEEVVKQEMAGIKNEMRITLQRWINGGHKPEGVESAVTEIARKINERTLQLFGLFSNAESVERANFLLSFNKDFSVEIADNPHGVSGNNVVNNNNKGVSRDEFDRRQKKAGELETQLNEALGLQKEEEKGPVKVGGGSLPEEIPPEENPPEEEFFKELDDLSDKKKDEELNEYVDRYNDRNHNKGGASTIVTGNLFKEWRGENGEGYNQHLTVDMLKSVLNDKDFIRETRESFRKLRMTVEMMGVDWGWLAPGLDFAIGIFVSPTAMLKTALAKIDDTIETKKTDIEKKFGDLDVKKAELARKSDVGQGDIDGLKTGYDGIRKSLIDLNELTSARRAMYNRMLTVLNLVNEVKSVPQPGQGDEVGNGKSNLQNIVEQFGVITSQKPKKGQEAGFFFNLFAKKETKATNDYYGETMRNQTGDQIVSTLSGSYVKFAQAQISKLTKGIDTLLPMKERSLDNAGKYKPVKDELSDLIGRFNKNVDETPVIKGKVTKISQEDRAWKDTWKQGANWARYTSNASFFVTQQFCAGIDSSDLVFNANSGDGSDVGLGSIAHSTTYSDVSI